VIYWLLKTEVECVQATKSRAEDAAAALIVAEERLNVAQSAGVNNKSTEADLVAANVRLEVWNFITR
jgi:hypothetical protein